MIWRYRYIMKTVIFAGGLGSRLSEETGERPKPMVEIGGKPILWHIMKIYSYYGFHEFIVLTGYLSHVIKDYFINYYTRYSDITVDMQDHRVTLHTTREEPWRVTMLYTGEQTMTGARLKKAEAYLKGERFLLTYGDGLSTINIPELIAFHKKKRKNRHAHGRTAGREVRCSGSDGIRCCYILSGKTQGRRSVDQRRLHGMRTGDFRPHTCQ